MVGGRTHLKLKRSISGMNATRSVNWEPRHLSFYYDRNSHVRRLTQFDTPKLRCSQSEAAVKSLRLLPLQESRLRVLLGACTLRGSTNAHTNNAHLRQKFRLTLFRSVPKEPDVCTASL